MRRPIFATLVAVSSTTFGFSQVPMPKVSGRGASRDSLKEATVAVYQTYQPELKPVFKPLYVPSVGEPDTTSFAQQYTVAPQPAALPYYPVSIRPLALPKDSAQQSPPDYLKVGGGNRSTFLLEGATIRIQASNLSSVLFLRHFRQADERVSSRKFNETEAAYRLRTQLGFGSFHALIEGQRKSYGEYAFNDSRALPVDGQKTYFGMGIATELDVTRSASPLRGTQPRIAFRYFEGPQIGGEVMLKAEMPLKAALGTGVQLEMTPSVNFTRVGLANLTGYNNLHALATALLFNQDRFTLRAGAIPAYVQDKGFRILPDLMLRYALVPQQTALELGWKGTIIQNRLEELTAQNPFLNRYTIAQTESREAYAEVNTNFGKALSLSVRGSYWNWKDLPLFVNDLSATNGAGFELAYANAKAASLQVRLRHAIGEAVQIGAFTQLMNYFPEDLPRLWHVPAVRFGADAHVMPVKELQVGVRISFMDGLYARGNFSQEIKLNPVTDLSAEASYRFIENWAVWLQGTNLLNGRNERYYGYPAIGRGVAAGLRVQF